MYRAANTDEAMLGKWSGFGAEGTKKIFWGDREAAEGFVGGGRVCSELTASRLLLL